MKQKILDILHIPFYILIAVTIFKAYPYAVKSLFPSLLENSHVTIFFRLYVILVTLTFVAFWDVVYHIFKAEVVRISGVDKHRLRKKAIYDVYLQRKQNQNS